MKTMFISLALSILFLTGSAEAHKVNVYAYREGEKVTGECYFMDGSPCINSRVEVYSSKGDKIFETKTDEKGRFAFNSTEKGELRIVIPASEGHRAEFLLEATEREIKEGERKRTDFKGIPKGSEIQPISINKEEIRQVINEAMEERLQGIRAELMDLHKKMDKVTLRDIIGAIGYIFGIWGLFSFIKRKRYAS